jgi:hypothetical protein
MKILPFTIESLSLHEDIHFQIVIDDQDRTHLLRLDVNELTGELSVKIIKEWTNAEIRRFTEQGILEAAKDFVELGYLTGWI